MHVTCSLKSNLKSKALGIASHLETGIKVLNPIHPFFMLMSGQVILYLELISCVKRVIYQLLSIDEEWTSELGTVTHLTSCMHFHQLCKENVPLLFEI